jgi:hypothetical protein
MTIEVPDKVTQIKVKDEMWQLIDQWNECNFDCFSNKEHSVIENLNVVGVS